MSEPWRGFTEESEAIGFDDISADVIERALRRAYAAGMRVALEVAHAKAVEVDTYRMGYDVRHAVLNRAGTVERGESE